MTSLMDFRELSYVLAIADHQNITRAAESLYVGQPTLSKFLISLEETLGIHLFRKVGSRYLLTYAGERYVDYARKIMQQKKDLDAEMADILRKDIGELSVAFTPTRSACLLPSVLPAFHELHPNVMINLLEGTSRENDQRLLDGKVELAFCAKPANQNQLISLQELWSEEMLLCTSNDHPLISMAVQKPGDPYPWLDLSSLKDYRVILMKSDHRTGQVLQDYLNSKGIVFPRIMETGNIPVLMELVSVGYGVSFLFESHLRFQRTAQPICAFRFGDAIVRSPYVAETRSGSYQSSYAKDFIRIVRQAGQNLNYGEKSGSDSVPGSIHSV